MTDHGADLDLTELARRRAELGDLASRQADLLVERDRRAAALDELVRRGGQGAALDRARTELAEVEARRTEAGRRRADLVGRIDELAGGLVAADDPAPAIESLAGAVPVALLPVRIETRFEPDATALHIRIFPDQVHLDAHEPALTADERAGGEWYWMERWPDLGDPERAERAWRTLAGRFRPGRARYVLETLRPTNLPSDARRSPVEPPTFPDTASRARSWSRPVEATALPERWVAIGYRNASELFRVWSSRVPDRLAAGPSPDDVDAPPPPAADARAPHVQDGFRWAVDPDAARDAGMLLTVRDGDLAFGRLADGLTRLIVVGVDWTLGPEEAAASLEALLAGHAWSGDLAFVAPGTTTNNTGSNVSGFSTAPAEQVAGWAPPLAGVDPDTTVEADAGRLAAALGVRPDALAVTPGAGGRHHQVAAALLDALWEATGGYFASEMADPQISDAVAGHVRLHAATSLFASGPLPLVRVGPQPYGVLPVAPRRLAPHIGRGADLELHRVTGLLRSEWEQQVDRLARLGLAGETPGADGGAIDDVMLDLLQRTPVPWHVRWREMVPPPQWSATDWLTRLRAQQTPPLTDLLDRIGVPPGQPIRLQNLTASPDSQPLDVPLVRKGDSGTAYLAELAALSRAGAEGRRELNLRQDSATLLEALLAFAATQELDKAASAELVVGMSAEAQAAAGFVRRGVRTPDLVRVEDPDPTRLPLQFTTSRALAATTAPGTNLAVHDRVARRLREAPLGDLAASATSPANGLARFLAALDRLVGVDTAELEWGFRGVLDLFATRLDAWITSLATARLAEHRRATPTGVHLGCYGWVEDLRPDAGSTRGPADSLGFIAAPSLDHAVAAAVLRSGRQAHVAEDAFDLDLGAARVREALVLLEGVAGGQSLAALVGYRIERRLRDRLLGDLIVPLRIAAPLQARGGELDEPTESVAARDVVDGLKLLAMLPTQAWLRLVADLRLTPDRRSALEAVLREVAGIADAVADVLFAETVHQTAAGNLDRAAAAAGALDRQQRPVEPDVVRTPRDGAVVTNRVVVALRGAAMAPAAAWPARGVRGRVEPRLDTWLGVVIGDPAGLSCGGRLLRGDETRDLGEVTAADLGLSPLALALASSRPAADQPTELEARIASVLAGRVVDPTEDDRIELEAAGLLRTVADWAARLASGSRPLQPSDLALAAGEATSAAAGAVDVDELSARVDDAVAAVRAAATGLGAAARDAAGLRAALADVAELVGAEALPAVPLGAPDEVALLTAQADDVTTLLAGRVARLDDLDARPLGAGDTDVSRLLAIGALALGPHQPILPVLTLADGRELAASAADRTALLAGDETAAVTWLHRSGLVRPDLDPLCGLLTHAEAGGVDVVGGAETALAVAQLPHRPGARWCELPIEAGAEPPPAGTIGVVAVAPGGFAPTGPLAGLVVDVWAEVIPPLEHTAGISFHYDAPGARPPQAIVLAVHPDEAPERWNLDYLVETVQETMSLSQLRLVGLRELDGLVGLVPGLFLPNNYTRDVPSVSFKGLIEVATAAELVTAPSGIRGKP